MVSYVRNKQTPMDRKRLNKVGGEGGLPAGRGDAWVILRILLIC